MDMYLPIISNSTFNDRYKYFLYIYNERIFKKIPILMFYRKLKIKFN